MKREELLSKIHDNKAKHAQNVTAHQVTSSPAIIVNSIDSSTKEIVMPEYNKDCEGGCNIHIHCGPSHHPHPPHKECPKPEFAEVYSGLAQTLAASPGPLLKGGVVTLENTIFSTPNIDVSQAASNGKIIVNRAGWYDVYTGMCGTLNPIPNPLPVWTLSLFKNGVLVPGSTFANMPLSPTQGSNEVVADVFVHLVAGDVLELANTSINPVFLTAPTIGTNAPTNSSYLKLILLEAD